MASLEVTARIDRVKEALSGKGFEDIYATHYDNTPSRMIVMHDDHGQVAHGEDEALTRIIEESNDVEELWASLMNSGMIRSVAGARA